MERRLQLNSTHTAAVSALAYQPVRRELITGHEDGSLKFWEVDTGKNTETVREHRGWISDLHYWTEGKVLFSCSVDGRVALWSSTNQSYDSVFVREPVFSLLWLSRKNLLLLGTATGLAVLRKSEKLAGNGLPLLLHTVSWLPGHTGIVRCLAAAGNKIYSAGYDAKLTTYEIVSLSVVGEIPLKTLRQNPAAHQAGITCLQIAQDSEGSAWVVTGSFDKKVKLWTGDGKLVHIIQCSDTVTGLCYVPPTGVLWVAAGTPLPLLYEPKSGDNVTEYAPILGVTSGANHHNSRGSAVQLLRYIPETSEVIGSTRLKQLVCWRCNPTCCTCCQPCPSTSHVETITFTSKVPILIFSGSFSGEMVKWEQLQLNSFLYSQDTLSYKEALLNAIAQEEDDGTSAPHRVRPGQDETKEDSLARRKSEAMKAENRGFVSSLFVESLDLLVASSLDGTIFVWGYDRHTVRVLEEMERRDMEAASTKPAEPSPGSELEQESSSIISRVAGFTCLHVLREHKGCVQALTAVENWTDGNSYLLSGGWDLTICLWSPSSGSLIDSLGEGVLPEGYTLHPNLIITSLSFSPQRKEFAYATSDGHVFVRRFALSARDWQMVRTLTGHTAEIAQVCWNGVTGQWVTGSSDCTFRLWEPLREGRREEGEGGGGEGGGGGVGYKQGSTMCETQPAERKSGDSGGSRGEEKGGGGGGVEDEEEMCISLGDPVSAVCVDQISGNIIIATQSTFKVYNRRLELLQVSRGHSDVIRSIIHIPDRKQYVTAGWDGTVRFWRAHS